MFRHSLDLLHQAQPIRRHAFLNRLRVARHCLHILVMGRQATLQISQPPACIPSHRSFVLPLIEQGNQFVNHHRRVPNQAFTSARGTSR